MKNILFLSLIAFTACIKAQDSAYCYNSGLSVSRTTETEVVVADNKRVHPLILMPYIMNEKEVVAFLKEKENSSLEKLLTKIKLSKNLRLISLAAIPTGIISVLSISDANKNHTSQNVGLGLAALGVVSLSTGVYFDHQRKTNYKKAIAKYNQLYN